MYVVDVIDEIVHLIDLHHIDEVEVDDVIKCEEIDEADDEVVVELRLDEADATDNEITDEVEVLFEVDEGELAQNELALALLLIFDDKVEIEQNIIYLE